MPRAIHRQATIRAAGRLPSLRDTVLQAKAEELQARLGAQDKMIRLLTKQLEQARTARRPRPIVPTKPRRKLKGDTITVTLADTHGNSVHRAAVQAALGQVRLLAPHRIILMGDHVNCGGFLAQHHTLGYVAETDYTYEEDIACADSFLADTRAAAPDALIEYLEGNHEARVERWCVTETLRNPRDAELLRRQLAPQFLLKLAERGIEYFRQGTCYDGLDTPGVIRRNKSFYLHGFTTARHAAAITRLRTAGNVNFGHIHRSQSDVGRSLGAGEHGAWCAGCLCELQPMWGHSRPSDWTLGIGVEFTSRTGSFLHINAPIIKGECLLDHLTTRHP